MRFTRTRVLCALAVLGAGAACNGGGDEDLPAETLAQVATRLTKAATAAPVEEPEPSSYRIEFARFVKGTTSDDTIEYGDDKRQALLNAKFTRSIVRPFDETGSTTRSLGFVSEAAGGDARVTFVRPLPSDPRPRVYPPTGKAQVLRIAGRACNAYTYGTERFCVDGAGLVLLHQNADMIEVATKVTVGTRTKSADQLTESVAKGFTDSERGSIRPVDPDSAPAGIDHSLDGSPAGFTLVGRYAVAPLTPAVLERTSRKVVGGIIDVYVRGIDSIVIERGGKLDLSPVGDEDIGSLLEAHDVDLGVHGTGKAGIGGLGPFGYREVRFFPKDGRYVVVAGTVPESELVAITQSLKTFPGTTLRYIDAARP